MTAERYQNIAENIGKEALNSLKQKTPKEILDFCEEIGIYDGNGNLTERYGGKPVAQLAKEFSHTHCWGICLYDPKNQMNVGASIRAAGAFDADFINVVGDRWKARRHPDWRNLDTEMAHKTIPTFFSPSMVIPYGHVLVGVERDGVPIDEFEHPRRAVYVFGPEDGRIPKLSGFDYCAKVSISSTGSLNLAACVNIVGAYRYAYATNGFVVANKKCHNCGSENVSIKNLHCNSCGEDID